MKLSPMYQNLVEIYAIKPLKNKTLMQRLQDIYLPSCLLLKSDTLQEGPGFSSRVSGLLDDYDTGKPPSQRRHSRSGQIGQSGRKRKTKTPSLRSPDPVIITTKSNFLLCLLEHLEKITILNVKNLSSEYWRSGQIYCFYYPRSPSCHGYGNTNN